MDASPSDSLRIPPVMSVYADQQIFDLVQSLVSILMVDQPEEPISYLIGLLKRNSMDLPRVIILGPPAAGKTTVARKLCAQLGSIHVTLDSLLGEQDLSKLQYTHTQQEVPAELLVRLIQQRLVKSDCLRQGWVLEGIPQTHQQALSLQEAGIIPDHVVMLEAPDDVLLERSQGRLVDPLTGDVYHQTFIRPPDQTVAQHLERGRSLSQEQQLANLQWYQYKVTDLSSAYHQVLKMVNADQLLAHVYQDVLGFVLTRRHSMGPYIPRILFIGPPGSGKSLQARLLSEKYNMVDVCCSQLLKSAAADGSSVGELVRPYLESGQQVPGSLVLQILTERLSRLDCSTRGWVLHGFPLDLEQARGLQESNHQPNRVFFLEITDDVSLERMTLRTTDPISGLRYHAVSHPAPTAEVQTRLLTRPAHTIQAVTDKLTYYFTHTAVLQSVYPDAVHIKADLDRHNVFEDLESRLIQGLTRPLTTDPETDQTTNLETDQTTDQ